MDILLTIAHVFAYAIIQTFGCTLFTLALQRLGRLHRLYRLKLSRSSSWSMPPAP